MATIVFTTPVLEHPAAGGPQLRIENTIKALARVSDLHCIARVPAEQIGREQDVAYLKKFCRSFAFAPSSSGLAASRTLMARAYRKFFQASPEKLVERDADFICQYAQQLDAEILWFGYGNISFPLIQRVRRLLPNIKIVCDTDSVWSRFILRELDVEANESRRSEIASQGAAKEEEERLSVNMCDVTTAVSEVDAAYFRSIAKYPERVHLFSNVIDVENYTTPPQKADGLITPCLFLGGSYGHDHSPMDRAAHWVIEEVMPKVLEAIPGMHLYLVGRGSERWKARLNSVPWATATGKVVSVLPYLCYASASLVPLMFESGTRFKILESGAIGTPLVSTTLGAEGIPVKNNKHLLIADTPQDFANAIIRLINAPDLCRELTTRCNTLIRSLYSVENLAQEGIAIINFLNERVH